MRPGRGMGFSWGWRGKGRVVFWGYFWCLGGFSSPSRGGVGERCWECCGKNRKISKFSGFQSVAM